MIFGHHIRYEISFEGFHKGCFWNTGYIGILEAFPVGRSPGAKWRDKIPSFLINVNLIS